MTRGGGRRGLRAGAAPAVERRQRVLLLATAAALGAVLFAGCGVPEDDPPPEPVEVEDVSPLSREELEMQAEAMSPEVAESLGIVDTTISVTRPVPPESVLLPGTPFDSLPEF